MSRTSNLISPAELNSLIYDGIERVNQETVSILDCSWYLPDSQINTAQEFLDKHIEGARFFHIDEVCDTQSEFPHMLPSAADFSKAVTNLGVANNTEVIVYVSAGLFSAARVWWMFRVFGHGHVRVLDGGLPAWIKFGGSVYDNHAESEPKPSPEKFEVKLVTQAVVNKSQIQENCAEPNALILDARSNDRFSGKAREPREGLPSGHIPHSVSMPFTELILDGKLKPVDEIRKILAKRGVDKHTRVITSCGSGVTAAIVTLALAESGFGLHQLYDGSWTEWASSDDSIILRE